MLRKFNGVFFGSYRNIIVKLILENTKVTTFGAPQTNNKII